MIENLSWVIVHTIIFDLQITVLDFLSYSIT